MAYEITATRKRPASFDQLAGQEFVSTTLKAAIGAGRIAHAFLFSGPRGCGKTSTARILAKALKCEKGPTAEPCGTCDSCVSIARGSSLDVIEIDGASNTSVENVRQIKDEVLFPPNASRYKVYIIDEVHMLSTSAFNALLKTIEEPPPYVVFMFATTEIHKVPATIKSRCQQFNFRLIPTETIKGLLAQAARETGVEADDDALLWIAKEATGSMRDAYTLFDQVVSFSGGKLSSASIREKLGLVGIERLNALFEVCFSGDGKATLESLDSILSSGVSVEQFVADSAEYLRSLMLVKNGIVRDSLLGAPAQAYSAKALGAVDAERIERALAIALGAHRDLRYSVSPRFELELAFSRIASLASTYTREEIARAMDRIQAALSGTEPKSIATASRPAPGAIAGAAPAADGKAQTGGAPEPEATASGAGSGATAESAFKDDAELEEARSADPALLRESVTKSFSKILPALASSLGKSGAWRIGERSVSIPFESGMDLEYVRREVGQIAAKVTEFAGRALSVELVKTAPTKQPERPREAEARPDAPDDDTDPVASVSRVFRGTVVSDGNGGNDELE